MHAPTWRDLLACPLCHAALEGSAPARCTSCHRSWNPHEGALDLVPPDLGASTDAGWRRWREALAGLDAWRARQRSPVMTSAPAVDARIVALVRDANLAGSVIDVGGKDGAKRHAMPPAVVRYLSVDPCAVARDEPDTERGGALSWGAVRGVAEALPLRDACADAVFSTAAMDYFVDTSRGVAEFARVLRDGGTLALLVTAHPPHVAQAREGQTRVTRALRALAPGVAREVGVRAAVSLAFDGARASAREHTRYLTEGDVLAALAAHFDVRSIGRDRGRYSTTLRIVATKRRA
jgi:SAM-dependent methyltransferase